jgi:uncharacterized Zn finger protein (UPF0148 family)
LAKNWNILILSFRKINVNEIINCVLCHKCKRPTFHKIKGQWFCPFCQIFMSHPNLYVKYSVTDKTNENVKLVIIVTGNLKQFNYYLKEYQKIKKQRKFEFSYLTDMKQLINIIEPSTTRIVFAGIFYDRFELYQKILKYINSLALNHIVEFFEDINPKIANELPKKDTTSVFLKYAENKIAFDKAIQPSKLFDTDIFLKIAEEHFWDSLESKKEIILAHIRSLINTTFIVKE